MRLLHSILRSLSKEDSVQEIQSKYEEAVKKMLQKDPPETFHLELEVNVTSVSCQKVKKEFLCKAELKNEGESQLK